MTSAIEQFLKKHKKQPSPKPVGSYKIRFGKHKDKTYDYIYENDKEYVAWVLTNEDETYIKRIKKYFIERIEQDNGEETMT